MRWYLAMMGSLLVSLSFSPLAFFFGKNFEYEYATFLSWAVLLVLPIFASVVPATLINRLFEAKLPTVPGAWQFRHNAKLWFAALILGPLCLHFAGLGAFFSGQCRCSQSGYFFWMALQVWPSYFLGLAIHGVILYRRQRSSTGRSYVSKVCAFIAASTALAAALLWFFPQKRLVSFAFGFLHGPIYDEWIPVDQGVVVARFAVALFALAFWIIGRRFGLKGSPISKTGVLIGAAAFSLWVSSFFYATGSHGAFAIKKVLNKEKSVGFVKIHYPAGGEDFERRMRVLTAEVKYHSHDIAMKLDIKSPRPIHVFVYPNRDMKKLLFGGGSTDVTDVWTPSIHITADDAPHGSLRHELVHAITSEFGWYGIGFHPNMAITEGLAVALAPGGSRRSIHEMSSVLLQEKKVTSLSQLFSPWGFWSQSGPRAYTVAGSFLLFLIEKVGAKSVLDIYGGSTFDQATGKPLAYWSKQWSEHVESMYNPALSIESESIFRSPGVLRDVCPHTKVDLARSRSDVLWTRLRQPLGWDPQSYLEWRVSFDPKDLSSKLDLWSRRVKEVASSRNPSAMSVMTWIETTRKARRIPAETVEDIELALLESDLRSLNDERSMSQQILDEVSMEAAHKSPGETLERQIAARLLTERSGLDPSKIREWRRYLAGWRSPPELLANEPWIFTYLRMRRERSSNRGSTMSAALFPAEEMDVMFRREWYRLLADRFLGLEDYGQAGKFYDATAQLSEGGRKDYYLRLKDLAMGSTRPP